MFYIAVNKYSTKLPLLFIKITECFSVVTKIFL